VSPCCDWPNGSAFAVVVETPLGVFELQSTPIDSELTRMPLTQRAGESKICKHCGVRTKPLARRTLRVSLARSPG
jgi:hypothetical protein